MISSLTLLNADKKQSIFVKGSRITNRKKCSRDFGFLFDGREKQ